MTQTGISIRNWLTLMAIVLPLLPVFIIAVRKAFADSIYIWLSVICLIRFSHSAAISLPAPPSARFYIDSISSLLHVTAFFLLFRSVILSRPFRDILAILFTAFLSVVITIYTLKGTAANFNDVALAESAIMIAAILLLFSRLRRNSSTFLFDMPPFWLAAGSLGYYTMYLITETAIRLYGHSLPPSAPDEKEWLLLVMRWIEYTFYIIAALIKTGREAENGLEGKY